MAKLQQNSDTQEISLREHEHHGSIVNAQDVALPFGIAGGNGFGLNIDELEKIASAPSLDFDMKGEYWTPVQPGERKRLIFQYLVKDELVPNKYGSDPSEVIPIDTAYFVESYNENGIHKQRMIRSCATVIVSFIIRNRVPRHAVMDIQYKGKKKGSTFFYDDFAFIPVIVNL